MNAPSPAWITSYQCGCTLYDTNHAHPDCCPHHAPHLSLLDDNPNPDDLALATQTYALTTPELVEDPPAGVPFGLVGAA